MSDTGEAFICDAIRTPIGRYGGALARRAHRRPGGVPIKALMARNPSADWEAVDEVMLGCANQAGEDNRNVARMAALLAGLPERDAGRDHQPALRLGPRRGRLRRAGDPRRRGRMIDRRRRREHDPRALRDGQGREAPSPASPEIFDTTIGWRFVNPAMKASLRHRRHARDGRERRRRVPGQPRRPGRLRLCAASSAPARAAERLFRRGDRCR